MNTILAANALKDVVAAYKATKRWLDWCEGMSAAKANSGLYTMPEYDVQLSIEVEKTYISVNKKPRMPSKNHKHQMYSDAYRLISIAGLDMEPGSIRDMDGIARVIAAATAAIAAAS